MLRHTLQYLKGSINEGLKYSKSINGLYLSGYSDSDWANSTTDRRSTTGYCFTLNPDGPPVSWKSKKQPTVALSTCEAEYMGYVACFQEALYLKIFLENLIHIETPITIHGDNQGAIALSKNPIVHSCSKHIDVKFHFIREK